MRKFGKESAAPDEGVDRNSGTGWLQNHCALAVCIVAIISLVLRTVFVYGVSADGGFALSGGANAQYHLHVVESILDGSFIFGSDAAINYPIGGMNVNPPLYDFLAAAIGAISSASFSLAVLAPIFGVLTIFPVYLIGKELSGYKVGFVAALIYGLMALPIVSSVFSNGNEYAFTAFLFALFTLELIKVARKVNDDEFSMKEVLIAGIFLGLIALTWNGFRVILVMIIITMVIQLVIDRFNSKDFKAALYSYSAVMLIGVAMAAVYYIPAGLWDAVFSGPVLITVVAVAFGFIFKALQSKPWIFTIPGLIIAFAVIAAVLFFVASDYFDALIFGNSVYTNSIMSDLVSNGVSISKMSSYFGWLLMWMPAILGIYELYVYARKDRSHIQLFKTMWFLILWVAAWTSYGAAVAVGCVFAVSSAYVICKVLKKADLKTYFATMKAAGFPGFFRKMIKPVPFLSVIIVAFLVVLPGAIYAVDAGISSNETYGYFSYGNTVYTVQTGDGYPASYIYDDFEESGDKDLAVASWIDNAADLEAIGFNTVNDSQGTGASAVAQMYLANGSAGATAAQIVRLILSNPDTNFTSCFGDNVAVYNSIKTAIDDPEMAKDEILANPDVYGNINSEMTDENAVYIASVHNVTSNMGLSDIMVTYGMVSETADEKIGYYLVDGSMLPLMYGDGSKLATMAYFADYAIDGNGAPSQFFSYITYYSNYYPVEATADLYGTFLWKALIGITPSDAGYSSSFSFLYDLTASNGSVQPMPGNGLAGYSIDSWYVMYNEDSTKTTADDGWEYMSYSDAISKQKKDGGIINYLSSMIMYRYDGTVSNSFVGSVVDENGVGIPGITVQVSAFNEVYGADMVFSETTTDSNGRFSTLSPGPHSFVTMKNGSVKLEYQQVGNVYTINNASFVGDLALGNTVDSYDNYLYVIEKDGVSTYIPVESGLIDSKNAVDADLNPVRIIPGTYTYQLRDETAAAVASGSVTFYAGENYGLRVSPSSYSVTATITDYFGMKVGHGTFVAVNTSNGEKYTAEIEDGTAKVYVPTGTYSFGLTDGLVANSTSTVSVTSDRTTSLTAYEAHTITVSGGANVDLNAYVGSFTAQVTDGAVNLPVSIGATSYGYTIYGTDGSTVYYGTYDGSGSVSLSTSSAYKVSGNIGASGTVMFINGDLSIPAAADNDGKFSVYLPSGTYTVYGYTSNKAFLDTKTISADVDLGSITLSDARTITATYQYASSTSKGNVGLPYADGAIKFTFDSKNWEIPTYTDSSGKASFVIPSSAASISVEFNNGSIDNGIFKASSLVASVESGTGSASATVTISKDEVVQQTVSSPYTMKLTPYTGGTTIDFNGSALLSPGQYTAEIDAKTGYYFDGTVYVYPGTDYFYGLNAVKVFGVEITKGDLDVLKITGDGIHDNFDGGNTYYFEYGVDYYLTSNNASTGYMNVGYIFNDGTGFSSSIDMTTTALAKPVKGYIGVNADGDAYISYADKIIHAKISSGAFDFTIPSNAGSVNIEVTATKTVSSEEYGFSGKATNVDISSGIVNVTAVSDNSVLDYDDDLAVSLDSVNFNNGRGTVSITVYNNTDTLKTYAITAGTAWTLDKTIQIVVASGSWISVEVSGSYDMKATGVGSKGMTLIVSDYNGTASKTVHLLESISGQASSDVVLRTAADSDNKDKLSGSEYMYALTFVNSGVTTESVISVTVSGDYIVSLMNASGSIVKNNGDSMNLAAQTSTVVYVKIMAATGDMAKVPGISVHTSYGDVTLTPSTMDVHVDSMTVSGDSAVDHKSGIPAGLWFIFALLIILLILIVWMGSKRGVFSRR